MARRFSTCNIKRASCKTGSREEERKRSREAGNAGESSTHAKEITCVHVRVCTCVNSIFYFTVYACCEKHVVEVSERYLPLFSSTSIRLFVSLSLSHTLTPHAVIGHPLTLLALLPRFREKVESSRSFSSERFIVYEILKYFLFAKYLENSKFHRSNHF